MPCLWSRCLNIIMSSALLTLFWTTAIILHSWNTFCTSFFKNNRKGFSWENKQEKLQWVGQIKQKCHSFLYILAELGVAMLKEYIQYQDIKSDNVLCACVVALPFMVWTRTQTTVYQHYAVTQCYSKALSANEDNMGATQTPTQVQESARSASYRLDVFDLGWIRAWRKGSCRWNVLCNCHQLLLDEMHGSSMTGHSLGAMPNNLCQGKPSWGHKDCWNTSQTSAHHICSLR